MSPLMLTTYDDVQDMTAMRRHSNTKFSTKPTQIPDNHHEVSSEAFKNEEDVGGILIECANLVSEIIDSIFDLPAVDLNKLEELQIQFDLWAAGVGVTSGKLDTHISTSQELSDSLFAIWLAFLRSLVNDTVLIFYTEVVSSYFKRIIAIIDSLCYLNSGIADEDFTKGLETTPQDSLTKETTLQAGIDDFVGKLATFYECLSELAPFLVNFLRDCERNKVVILAETKNIESNKKKVPMKSEDPEPHDWHKRRILDKFPEIEPKLAEQIGIEIWSLYEDIKFRLHNQDALLIDIPIDLEVKSAYDRDSAYESLQKSLAPSLFRSAPQYLSLNAVDFESEISTSSYQPKDRPLVPLPPEGVDISSGVPFKCQFCFKIVHGIDNTQLWRKHVLSDINPYFCTFTQCRGPRVRYGSKSAWMSHELQEHRIKKIWACKFTGCDDKFTDERSFLEHSTLEQKNRYNSSAQSHRDLLNAAQSAELDANLSKCGICCKKLPNKASRIASHVGRHLEDFALQVLTQIDGREDKTSEEGDSKTDRALDGDQKLPKSSSSRSSTSASVAVKKEPLEDSQKVEILKLDISSLDKTETKQPKNGVYVCGFGGSCTESFIDRKYFGIHLQMIHKLGLADTDWLIEEQEVYSHQRNYTRHGDFEKYELVIRDQIMAGKSHGEIVAKLADEGVIISVHQLKSLLRALKLSRRSRKQLPEKAKAKVGLVEWSEEHMNHRRNPNNDDPQIHNALTK